MTLDAASSTLQIYFSSTDLSPALRAYISTCLIVLIWVLQKADWIGYARGLLGRSTCEAGQVGNWRRWEKPPDSDVCLTPVEGEE